MIRLNYIDHISPYGVMLREVGRIHSPILGQIRIDFGFGSFYFR